MVDHSFVVGNAGAQLTNLYRGLSANTSIIMQPRRSLGGSLGAVLVRHGLDELANPQAASVLGCFQCRQCVVGADALVTVRHIGLDSNEE